ncbi:MAG: hypothetical protein JWM28_2440 [Chitinophagaceae bacterium]|nr:hypothetical protein [Chitinophagaceae bacterium]
MKQKKLDTLLIIRGLLAVSVVVWHLTSTGQNIPAVFNIPGRTAVWFFFGISGYVIAYGFLTKRYHLNGVDIKAFYINRFLRIYPLFLLLSLLVIVTEHMLNHRWMIGFQEIPSQLFMLQFNHEYVLSGVFWTLGIEVQFYLIAPLLVALLLQGWRNIYSLSILLYFLMVAWVPFSFYFLNGSFDGRNLVSNLSHFFIGMIGCKLVINNKGIKINKYLLVATLLSIIFFTNYLYGYSIKFYWTLGTILIDVAIFLSILLHAELKEGTTGKRNLTINFFSFLGIISYGIYAWHPFLIKYIPFLEYNILYAIAATVFVAFLCYKLIEQPILRFKKQHIKPLRK